ncbi:MAG: PTS sugar transporter subunit IIA [Acidobacteriota bacterium]
MDLASLLSPGLIFHDLQGAQRDEVLRELTGRIAASGAIDQGDILFQRILEREELGSTALGQGVAVPHCKLKGLRQPLLAVALVPAGVEFGAPDGEAVKVLFLLASPEREPVLHLQALAAISKWVRSGGSYERLAAADDSAALFALLATQEIDS